MPAPSSKHSSSSVPLIQHFRIFVPLLAIILSIFVDASNGQGTRDVLVDDNDPRIRYSGGWQLAEPTELNIGGSHMLAQDPGAFATFEFVGVAVYFYSPLWPYHVTTGLQLDSRTAQVIELIDRSRPDTGGGPETVPSAVVWEMTGLVNTSHRLRIFVGAGEPYAIVDAIGYTELLPVSSSSSSSSSSSLITSSSSSSSLTTSFTTTPSPSSQSTTDSSNSANPTTGQNNGNNNDDSRDSSNSGPPLIPIIVGSVAGTVAVIALVGTILYCCCRRSDKRDSRVESDYGKNETSTIATSAGGLPSGPGALGRLSSMESNQEFNPYMTPSHPASSPATSNLPLRHSALVNSMPSRSDVAGISYYGAYSPSIGGPPAAATGAATSAAAGSPVYSIYTQQSQNSLRSQGSSPGMAGVGTMFNFPPNPASTVGSSGYSPSPVLFSQQPLAPPAPLGPGGPSGPWMPHDERRFSGGNYEAEDVVGPLPNPHPSPAPMQTYSHSQVQPQTLDSQYPGPTDRLTPLRPPSAAPPAYTEGAQGSSNRLFDDTKYRATNSPFSKNQLGSSSLAP